MTVINMGRARRLYGFGDERLRPGAGVLQDPAIEIEPTPTKTPAELYDLPVTPPTVVDQGTEAIQRTVSMSAMISLPFFAYLTFTDRLPVWARLISAMMGAGILVGEGGLIQRWSAKDAGEEPLFDGFRSYKDCGCGCGGSGGCK